MRALRDTNAWLKHAGRFSFCASAKFPLSWRKILMTPEGQIQTPPTRVSILARIVPAFSYALPALGAALSAFLFINVMQAMRNAEAAGIAAVAGGISEANMAIVVALYLAIFLGFAGVVVAIVRAITATTTASPAGWLFVVMALLGISPGLSLWRAESLLLDVLMQRAGPGVSAVAEQITLCLYVTIGLAPVVCLILLVASVVPLPAALRARSKWSPVIFLVLMELAVIGITVAYHLRTYYFHQAMLNEGF
jgi:hypothetical protein